MDTFSRFSPTDILADRPNLKKKVKRALASGSSLPSKLTQEEADFLIDEGGGPDPNYPIIPRQLFLYGGRALIVQGGSTPMCWRL